MLIAKIRASMLQTVDEILGPQGPFAQHLANFSPRAVQQDMALLVERALDNCGKLVVEAEGLNYAWDGEPVVRDFSTTIA